MWESFVGISSSTRRTGRKKRNTLENTPETPRKKLVHTGNEISLQAKTLTSSMEGPHTRLRSRDQEERQDREKLLSQNDEFDEGWEAFTMLESTNENRGNQVGLQNVGEQ